MRKSKHENHKDAVEGTRRDFCVGMVPSSALHLRHACEFDLNYRLIERVAESRGFFSGISVSSHRESRAKRKGGGV